MLLLGSMRVAMVTAFFAVHAQAPEWKALHLGNSQAVLIEAASRIASQHSQDMLRHRFMSNVADAPLPNHPPTQQPPHLSTEFKSQGSALKTDGRQRAEKVVPRTELASSGSLALLKSLRKSVVILLEFHA